MSQECTALATIWPGDGDRRVSRYELWENFRPVWHPARNRPALSLVSGLDHPLATLIALHLACVGQLERITLPRLPLNTRTPLALSEREAHKLYRTLQGRAVSIVRHRASVVSDRELECLRDAGAQLDLLDSEWAPAGGGWA